MIQLCDIAHIGDHENDLIFIVEDRAARDECPFSGLKFLLDRNRPLFFQGHQRSGSGDRSIIYKLFHIDSEHLGGL